MSSRSRSRLRSSSTSSFTADDISLKLGTALSRRSRAENRPGKREKRCLFNLKRGYARECSAAAGLADLADEHRRAIAARAVRPPERAGRRPEQIRLRRRLAAAAHLPARRIALVDDKLGAL